MEGLPGWENGRGIGFKPYPIDVAHAYADFAPIKAGAAFP
jgi:hypothetical protein